MNVLLHGHHEWLLTFGVTADERTAEILDYKDHAEWELRFRRMRAIDEGEYAELPEAVRRAGAEWIRAKAELDRAGAELERADWIRAEAEWERAEAEWERAYAALRSTLSANSDGVESWHRRHCSPDCLATPENDWNIFG